MTVRPAFLSLALLLAACGGTETGPDTRTGPVTAIGDTPWRLVSVNGEEVGSFPMVLKIAGGFISGQGPCNTVNADYVGEAPAFEIGNLITTKMMCDGIAMETRVFEAIADARRAVVADGRLTISGDGSPVLVFVPAG